MLLFVHLLKPRKYSLCSHGTGFPNGPAELLTAGVKTNNLVELNERHQGAYIVSKGVFEVNARQPEVHDPFPFLYVLTLELSTSCSATFFVSSNFLYSGQFL